MITTTRPAPEIAAWRKVLTLGVTVTAVLTIAIVALPFGALSANGRPTS
jgi:hypothetical protein